MGEISKLGAVSLNCPDPHALAVFYSALLEKEITFESDDFSAIQLDNLWLSMQRVEDFKPSTWPANETPSSRPPRLLGRRSRRGPGAGPRGRGHGGTGATRAGSLAGPHRSRRTSVLSHRAHSGLTLETLRHAIIGRTGDDSLDSARQSKFSRTKTAVPESLFLCREISRRDRVERSPR